MPPMSPTARAELASLDEMVTRLERALASSTAEATELVWIEARRTQVTAGRGRRDASRAGGAGGRGPCERNLLVRVRQSGRTGLHRTGGIEPSELENAVRDAMAQARLAPATAAELLAGAGERRDQAAAASAVREAAPASGAREATAADPATRQDRHAESGDPNPGPPGVAGRGDRIYDPELAELEPARARALLEGAAEGGELLRLAWLEGRVAVVNSAGLRQSAQVTAASFEASCGRGPGAGRAAGAARRLDALYLHDTLDRARSRHAVGDTPAPDAVPAAAEAASGLGLAGLPLVLSEQSGAALIALLNHHALSAAAHRDAGSCPPLRGKLGELLLASCLSLRDDGTDPRALPFPFDLAGWAKRRVDLILDGIFTTPAVDARLAAAIARPPTPHALARDESIAANLILLPGDREPLPEGELLRQADGGIWIGALDGLECFDPRRLRCRAQARGVRQIAGGTLGPPLPDFAWEDDLRAALSRAAALGDRPVTIATGDMLFGATAAPLLALRAG
ncbi:MAG: hypothetical protein JOZ15_01255 [Acidobacteria bacterium]|nr:hypothetical protein [Acidobacteriota bacterium]